MSIDVLKPGMFSTFQDLGRHGLQHLGVPVSGAMDELSHRIANLLVGNDDNEATLEITLMGPTLRFDRAVRIALAGADLGAVVIGPGDTGDTGDKGDTGATRPLALHTPTHLHAGSTLQFGRRISGVRCYLAIAGGFGLPEVMGSRSTYVRGGLGGFEGRALRKGDRIVLAPARSIDVGFIQEPPPSGTAADPALQALIGELEPGPIRALRGREWEQFTSGAQSSFFSAPAVVGAQSERMGYRLQGLVLERADTIDMVSEAVAFGSVQVPNDGLPIVLMADRQSTGGYPRIAQVASVDLPRLAQVMPGESIRFAPIDIDAAQQLLLQRARQLHALRASLRAATTTPGSEA